MNINAGRNRTAIFLGNCLMIASTFVLMLIASDPGSHRSLMHAYNQIELGMSRGQAVSILHAQNIYCGFADVQPGNDLSLVRFSDLWRYYTVRIDPRTGFVVGKQFGFITRRSPLTNLFEALRSVL